MEQRFLEKLPDELRAAVPKIEELAGRGVVVRPVARAREFDSLIFGVKDGECVAEIEYKGGDINLCALVHEGLHLKRYCLDGVPVLRAAKENAALDAQRWEDLLEHLVIIPEERRFAEAESNAHWRAVLDAHLGELTRLRADISQGQFQRGLIELRAMLDIALPALDHTAVYSRLREEKLFDRSTPFIESLRGAVNDKLRGVGFVIQLLGFDPAG